MQDFVTVTIPFAGGLADQVRAALSALGNPATGRIAADLDETAFVHFISMSVVHESGERRAHLVLEASVDGGARSALARIATTVGPELSQILQLAGITPRAPLNKYLERHRFQVIPGLFTNIGVAFSGTPGMSVPRIRGEARLAFAIRDWLERGPNRAPEPALAKLEGARTAIFLDPTLKWALFADGVPLLGEQKPLSAALGPILLSAFQNMLWPLLIFPVIFLLPLLNIVFLGLLRAVGYLLGHLYGGIGWAVGLFPALANALERIATSLSDFPAFEQILHWSDAYVRASPGIGAALGLVPTAVLLLGGEILVVGFFFFLQHRQLRASEQTSHPQDEEPDAVAVGQLMSHENWTAQNHLTGVSVLKPRLVRFLVLRLVFWLTGALAASYWRPGFLFCIGSIHFARWLILPRTNKLLFLSNYDGSWESYLEDFIVRAHTGLSAIWSNTLDFPKTDNLIEGGARDGERFKRWARRQQRATNFWYSAYPNLTTTGIRANAAIRHGLASATTEEDAALWLRNLGFPVPPTKKPPAALISTPPPAQPIEPMQSEEIPTLVFGGLPRLTLAQCMVVRLEGPVASARDWLRAVEGKVSYGERATVESAFAAGFTACGLWKIGLREDELATFPTAFQHGMSASWRARALGDTEDNAPQNWLWGNQEETKAADAILLVYATTQAVLRSELAWHRGLLRRHGHPIILEIELKTLPGGGGPIHEPFGFVDGISQPIIRGSRRWEQQQRSAIHAVQPGELVLGYPDNLGNRPPTPVMGCNGTFLVARHLEQDPDSFESYLDHVATEIALDPRSPSRDVVWLREWVAAKMVGRWRKDGSSLVRYRDPPGSRSLVMDDPDNDFLFGAEDPDGGRCPFGAHIRRANPRESFEPGSQVQMSITNRHRILRVGRRYAPQVYVPQQHDPDKRALSIELEKPGLLFLCVNADIERQFEFLQQTWVLGRDFQGLGNESDFLISRRGSKGDPVMSLPTPNGSIRITRKCDFVLVRGGGYFFMPGRSAVRDLAG